MFRAMAVDCSILMLSYFLLIASLQSPDLLLSYSIITIPLYITIILITTHLSIFLSFYIYLHLNQLIQESEKELDYTHLAQEIRNKERFFGFIRDAKVIQDGYGAYSYEYRIAWFDKEQKTEEAEKGNEGNEENKEIEGNEGKGENQNHSYSGKALLPDTCHAEEDFVRLHNMDERKRLVISEYRNLMKIEAKDKFLEGKLKVKKILQRSVNDSGMEYKVCWDDKTTISTWHQKKTLLSKGSELEDMLSMYDARCDGIIRLYLNQPNKYRKSSFMSACEFGKSSIVSRLLEVKEWQNDDDIKYSLVNTYRDDGISAFMYATASGNIELIQTMINHGADLLKESTWKDTALFWSVKDKFPDSPKIVKLLLDALSEKYSSDPLILRGILNSSRGAQNMPTVKNNCLMLAANMGNLDICKLLITYGAEKFLDGKTSFNAAIFNTAADYAFLSKFYEVAFFLDQNGTLFRLRNSFRRRCEANTRVRFLAEGENLSRAGEEETVYKEDLEDIDKDSKKNSKSSSSDLETSGQRACYRPHDSERRDEFVVVKIQDKTNVEVAQSAFNYYLSRVEEFGYIARLR